MNIIPETVTEIQNKINPRVGHLVISTFTDKSLRNYGKTGITIHMSLDPKDKWVNNIFHNSRFAIFMIDGSGSCELIGKNTNMPKFRKSQIKSSEHLIERLTKYISEAWQIFQIIMI